MPHLHQLLVQVSLVEADVDGVTSGHHVVVVDNLQSEKVKYISRKGLGKRNNFSVQKPGIGYHVHTNLCNFGKVSSLEMLTKERRGN